MRVADLTRFGQAQPPAAAGGAAPDDDAASPARLEQAREAAYREGFEAGQRDAAQVLDQQRAHLQALIAGLDQLIQDFEQTLADDVLSISLELAKLIVRQTVRVNPAVILPVVRDAITSLPGIAEQTVIALNPDDAVLMRQLAEGDAALAALPWKIVEDPQLERGGCRLETASTEVDATLETRWRRVIAALGREDAWIDITV